MFTTQDVGEDSAHAASEGEDETATGARDGEQHVLE